MNLQGQWPNRLLLRAVNKPGRIKCCTLSPMDRAHAVQDQRTPRRLLRIIQANNTPHASLRCAPWGVTFFWGAEK